MDKTPAVGLDETRRLLYMALLRPRTEKYELAGTLVHALAHHHPDGTSAEDIADHVVNVIEKTGEFDISRVWVRRQIQRLTSELNGDTDDHAAPASRP